MEKPAQDVQPLAGTEARFHRFTVGQISCTSLSDGGILVHLPPRPPSAAETPAAANDGPKFLLVPLSCLVVKMPQTGQLVLMDSGFGLTPEILDKPMQSAGRLQESLKAAGLSTDAIDILLISHFDLDHVAGLYDSAGNQVFPKATYYASAEAVEFWSRKDVDLSGSPTLPWLKKERLLVAEHMLTHSKDRLKIFSVGDEIIPGIKAVDLPGHAPGQVGFVLSSDEETLLYTADAITNAKISLETPDVHNIMDLDPHLAVKTRHELLGSLASSGWRSFSPHFPFPAWGNVQKVGETHVWNPGV